MASSTNFNPNTCYDLTATVTVGGTSTPEIDLTGSTLAGIFVPSTFDGSAITIQAAAASGGTFVTVQSAGSDFSLATTASKYCPIENLSVVAGLRFIKLVCGSTQTTTDTVFTLATRPV